MKKTKIAILGATSHIAKGLIDSFLEDANSSLALYTRSADKVQRFLKSIGKSLNQRRVIHQGYRDFKEHPYDVVINCVGVGTAKQLQGDYTKWFTVTEKYDNLVIDYLQNYQSDALYFSFSSGAVYGRDFSVPKEKNSINCLPVNQITYQDYYGIVRLNAEAKHRAFKHLRIVDLRLFSYFSRFIDLTDDYFITELLRSILNKKVFVTNKVNIIRDYVHPQDLFSMIQKCIKVSKINEVFDVTSAKPVTKQEIFDYFSSEYGLKYQMKKSLSDVSATGAKNIYYSRYNKAKAIGYKPQFTSLETIQEQSKYILDNLLND